MSTSSDEDAMILATRNHELGQHFNTAPFPYEILFAKFNDCRLRTQNMFVCCTRNCDDDQLGVLCFLEEAVTMKKMGYRSVRTKTVPRKSPYLHDMYLFVVSCPQNISLFILRKVDQHRLSATYTRSCS
jgi:hypothetical protein